MADVWCWWAGGHEVVHILSRSTVDRDETAQVVVPSRGLVRRVAAVELMPLHSRPWRSEEVVWRAAACRAIRAMAPPGMAGVHRTSLEPLPHQLVALERAMATSPVRMLLADEVGLGKTIEAGLIHAELKARGRVRRTLIVAPKGVQLQWAAEMSAHFGEEFVRVGAGVPLDAGINPWTTFDQVVCSVDAVKPLTARAGWSVARVAEHNQLRVHGLVDAGWDLIIIDEAHHVAGSEESVARHQLALDLSSCAPNILLLSATPHSGKSDAFARLLGLIDDRFRHGWPVTRENVAPIVVRADKRHTTDQRGNPLFVPRTTTLRTVPYGNRHVEHRLYDAVTEYVRHGYKRAKAEKRPAVGFLVLLMQRLASSSTAAILSALERRHAAILTEGTQLRLFPEHSEEWGDLDGEEQVAALNNALGAAWGNELKEVELLLDLARRAINTGLDAKARDLLGLIDSLASTEGDPNLKVVVFTEFTATQQMLLDLFESTGISAVAINGTLGVHDRATVQEEFMAQARVLVSTDAGGEGVNLQFAHVVVNYDLPWSPSKVEQRIGRVDRIGQRHPVRAINLAMEESIDARILEVLESKLQVILDELGADKHGDILHSADTHTADLYLAALTSTAAEESAVNEAADAFQEHTTNDTVTAGAFHELVTPSPPQSTLTVSQNPDRWIRQAIESHATLLPHVDVQNEDVLTYLPEVSPNEPIPTVPGPAAGLFALWEVGYGSGDRTADAVFVTDQGAVRPDYAERMWDGLGEPQPVTVSEHLQPADWEQLWDTGRAYVARPPGAHDPDRPLGMILRLLVRASP